MQLKLCRRGLVAVPSSGKIAELRVLFAHSLRGRRNKTRLTGAQKNVQGRRTERFQEERRHEQEQRERQDQVIREEREKQARDIDRILQDIENKKRDKE